MKNLATLIICLLLSASLLAQERFPIPQRTDEQKHSNAIFQLYTFMAAGINFAASKGVSPYEYGKSLGAIFAPSWQPENDFDVFVKGVLSHVDLTRRKSDPAIFVKENTDGSVVISTNEKIWHRYYSVNNPMTSYHDFLEFMRGLYEPISDHMGTTFKSEVRDTLLVFTLKKK